MLSQHELGYLRALTRKNTVGAFLEEQALRSRASKSQQLRVYGYWRRGPIAKREVKIENSCAMTHRGDVCVSCQTEYEYHNGHRCLSGTFGFFLTCQPDNEWDEEEDDDA